jgi:hypothetical protein
MNDVRQPDGPPLIEVEHLTMRFGGLVAVDDVSFAARPREITTSSDPTAPARRRSSTASPVSTSLRSAG